MGFVGDVLSGESGIQWYYIIGLFIFILLFLAILYRVVKLPKSQAIQYKESILDPENSTDRI